MGKYKVHGKDDGKKTTYRNEETGAMLQFSSPTWVLVSDKGGSKTQYSSSDNANRNVPWGEKDENNGKSYEMNGKSWRRDKGEQHDSELVFKGMDASAFYIT